MVQDLPKTISSSKTTSFRSYEIFTHWLHANTVTSFPSKRPIWSESWEKILFKRWVADFSDRHSFRWKWFRTYLRPYLVQKQQVWSHMKYSPIDQQPIPFKIHQKISKITKFWHIFWPRWPLEHIQQAVYAK